MTPKCGSNKEVTHKPRAWVLLILFIPTCARLSALRLETDIAESIFYMSTVINFFKKQKNSYSQPILKGLPET